MFFIPFAITHQVVTVAIDEKLSRRMARFHELRVTGSVGILVRAAKARLIPNLNECFSRMHETGVWISESLKEQALHAVISNLRLKELPMARGTL